MVHNLFNVSLGLAIKWEAQKHNPTSSTKGAGSQIKTIVMLL
jgi:hypothetical protein